MSARSYVNGVLREYWNDATRTYTAYNSSGVQTSTRPYTTAENTALDAGIAQDTLDANKRTIETQLNSDLVTLQAIIDTANGAFSLNQLAAAVKDMARVQRRQVRLQINKLDGAT